jgi:hypothetical protein
MSPSTFCNILSLFLELNLLSSLPASKEWVFEGENVLVSEENPS